jgi:hypothetical protein
MLYEPANRHINSDRPGNMGSIFKEDVSELELAEQISEKTSGFIQSSKHRDLLDIVDALRSNGVSH